MGWVTVGGSLGHRWRRSQAHMRLPLSRSPSGDRAHGSESCLHQLLPVAAATRGHGPIRTWAMPWRNPRLISLPSYRFGRSHLYFTHFPRCSDCRCRSPSYTDVAVHVNGNLRLDVLFSYHRTRDQADGHTVGESTVPLLFLPLHRPDIHHCHSSLSDLFGKATSTARLHYPSLTRSAPPATNCPRRHRSSSFIQVHRHRMPALVSPSPSDYSNRSPALQHRRRPDPLRQLTVGRSELAGEPLVCRWGLDPLL
jgi:hypothetical protein